MTSVTGLPSRTIDAATSVAMYEPPTIDDALGVGELVAQLVGVAERADVVDAVAHPAVDLQPADPAAGRQQRLAEAQLLAAELRRLAPPCRGP